MSVGGRRLSPAGALLHKPPHTCRFQPFPSCFGIRLTHDISLDLISADVESDTDVSTPISRSKSSTLNTYTRKNSLNDTLSNRNNSNENLPATNQNANANNNPLDLHENNQTRTNSQQEVITESLPNQNKNNYSEAAISNQTYSLPPPQRKSSQAAVQQQTSTNNLNSHSPVKKRSITLNNKLCGTVNNPLFFEESSDRDNPQPENMVHLKLISTSVDPQNHHHHHHHHRIDIKQDFYTGKKRQIQNGTSALCGDSNSKLHVCDSEKLKDDILSRGHVAVIDSTKTPDPVRAPEVITLETVNKNPSPRQSTPLPPTSLPIGETKKKEMVKTSKPADEAKVIENVQRNMRKRANVSKKSKKLRKHPLTPDSSSPEALSPTNKLPPGKSLADELLEVKNCCSEEDVDEMDDGDKALAALTSMSDSFYGGKLGTCEGDGGDEQTDMVTMVTPTKEEEDPKVIQLDENFFMRKHPNYDSNYSTRSPVCDSPQEVKLPENHLESNSSAHVSPAKELGQVTNTSPQHNKSVNDEKTLSKTAMPVREDICNYDINNDYRGQEVNHDIVRHMSESRSSSDQLGSFDDRSLSLSCSMKELNQFYDQNSEYIDDDPGDNDECRHFSEMMTLNFNSSSSADRGSKAFLSSNNQYLQEDSSPEEKTRKHTSILGLLGKKGSTESNHSSPVSSIASDEWDILDATHRGCHKFIPRHPDEMPVEIGDPIHVFYEADDMWCEGINLRLKVKGVFPSVYATDLDFLENEVENIKLAKFTLHFLGSVEVNYHKGNDVICQAMQKVVLSRRMTLNCAAPSLCCLEITEYGIKMINKSKRNRKHSNLSKNNTIRKKIAKIMSKQDKESTNEQFFSLKNISFCGHHPRNDHYFAFITKHPLEMRFACHVFVGEFSTKPICAVFGKAFKKFYQEYMAFAHPTEDIYME